jgi:hypothetical protein
MIHGKCMIHGNCMIDAGVGVARRGRVWGLR